MTKNNNNNDMSFKMKTMEWRGYTVKALESITDDIRRIDKTLISIEKKIDKLQYDYNTLYVKVGVISGVLGLIAGCIASAIMHI